MNEPGYSKKQSAAAKKARRRKLSDPLPTEIGECIAGDVVCIPEFGKIEIAFFTGEFAMVRKWGPPTRDRIARQKLFSVSECTPVECLECDDCDRDQECDACDGTGYIGLFF